MERGIYFFALSCTLRIVLKLSELFNCHCGNYHLKKCSIFFLHLSTPEVWLDPWPFFLNKGFKFSNTEYFCHGKYSAPWDVPHSTCRSSLWIMNWTFSTEFLCAICIFLIRSVPVLATDCGDGVSCGGLIPCLLYLVYVLEIWFYTTVGL